MIVVSDSSAIVLLMNIGHIDLLPGMFGSIMIPTAVVQELSSEKRPTVVRDFIASPPHWLEIRSPSSIQEIPGLDEGEISVIALAIELAADRIIMDESSGRKAAIARQIKVIGTIGILIAAAERKMVDLEMAFRKVNSTDFWVSPKFLDEQLRKFCKRKHS